MLALRLYERALARRPLITQAVSAGVLAGVGDAFSQLIIEGKLRRKEYDPIRTARFAGVVAGLMAPMMFHWFRFLEGVRGPLYPFKRVLIDQSLAAPVFTFSLITNLRLLEGHAASDAINGAKARIRPILITNYKVWPFLQLFNFYMIPLQYRIVFVQTAGIFWNAYLSYMTQSSSALQKL